MSDRSGEPLFFPVDHQDLWAVDLELVTNRNLALLEFDLSARHEGDDGCGVRVVRLQGVFLHNANRGRVQVQLQSEVPDASLGEDTEPTHDGVEVRKNPTGPRPVI